MGEKMNFEMRPIRALLCVTFFWALIYLPGLGTQEIKGEEGRRIFPAVAMLESGDWIVPSIGGEPYLRKPPLINWLIAGSFEMFGARNEWAARFPSALSVLFLGWAMVWGISAWRNVNTALIAALIAIGSISMIEKGRLAEIEAAYVALTGIALMIWFGGWMRMKSPWFYWPAAFVFLGLGMLMKGPLHLLFFYAVVISILIGAKKGREFFSLPHLLGFLVMVGIFAAWAVPYFRMTSEAAQVWGNQFAGRVSDNKFDLEGWLLGIPRGISNFLPWILLAPLLWKEKKGENFGEWDATIYKGIRRATLLCFFGLLIIPGVLPRYTMPLAVPVAMLVAVALENPDLRYWDVWHWFNKVIAVMLVVAVWVMVFVAKAPWYGFAAALLVTAVAVRLVRMRMQKESALPLVLGTMALLAMAIIFSAVALGPLIQKRDNIRPAANEVNSRVPEKEVLWVLDPGYEPFLFYIRPGCRYFQDAKELPKEARYALVRETKMKEMKGIQVEILAKIKNKDKNLFLLLKL